MFASSSILVSARQTFGHKLGKQSARFKSALKELATRWVFEWSKEQESKQDILTACKFADHQKCVAKNADITESSGERSSFLPATLAHVDGALVLVATRRRRASLKWMA